MSVGVANWTPDLHLEWFEWTILIASKTWPRFAELPIEREKSMNMPKEKEATYYSEFRTTLRQTNHSLVSQRPRFCTEINLKKTVAAERSGCYGSPWRSSGNCAIVHMDLNFWPMRRVVCTDLLFAHLAAQRVHSNWACPRRVSMTFSRSLLVTRCV